MSETRIEIRDVRTPGWFWIRNEVLDVYAVEIGAYGIAVYAALCRFADVKTQKAWPSLETIADRAGCGERTARAKVKLLEEVGLIEVRKRAGRAHLYVLRSVAGPTPARAADVGGPTPARAADPPARAAAPPAADADEQDTENKSSKNNNNPGDVFSPSLRQELVKMGMAESGVEVLEGTWSPGEAWTALSWVRRQTGVANEAGYLVALAKRGVDPEGLGSEQGADNHREIQAEQERLAAKRCWEKRYGQCSTEEDQKAHYTWCERCTRWAEMVGAREVEG